ncbi:MAG TPA: phage holin family protein [Longimicrobiales bacterium]|nr:phage holin family protein [Longimicrobiales bacterium]
MLAFLLSLVVSALLLILVAAIVDGVEVEGFGSALAAALVLGLANAVLRPVATLLALPINILTLGLLWWLVRWLINALMLWLTAAVVPGFRVRGLGPAFWGAAVLTIGNLLLGWLF